MFKITEEQIFRAREKPYINCPFGLAFAEGLGLEPSCISVGMSNVFILVPGLKEIKLQIPSKERKWIYAFDHNEDSRPITFSPEKWEVMYAL